MLGRNGMPVIQFTGLPDDEEAFNDVAAVVIALKSRTIPASEAVTANLTAARWLHSPYCMAVSCLDGLDPDNALPPAKCRAGG